MELLLTDPRSVEVDGDVLPSANFKEPVIESGADETLVNEAELPVNSPAMSDIEQYDHALEREADKIGSYDLAREALARHNIYPPAGYDA